MFDPQAAPSNPIACGISRIMVEAAKVTHLPIPNELKFKMALHRAVLRGNGFYDLLVRNPDKIDVTKEKFMRRDCLPVVNLIDLPGEHIEALMQEALPADRQRFIKYLSERPLGLGCITAVSCSVN
jgi:hypothetical protein